MIHGTLGDFHAFAQSIVYGVTDTTWRLHQEPELAALLQCGWKLQAGFARLRSGERRLNQVAAGADSNSGAYLEALLAAVVSIEEGL